MEWDKHDGPTGEPRACSDCRSSDRWAGYPPSFLVCREAGALKHNGGPRACSIVRAPGGYCGPEGSKWGKK